LHVLEHNIASKQIGHVVIPKTSWKTSHGTLNLSFTSSKPQLTIALHEGGIKKVECRTPFPQISKKNLPQISFHLYPVIKRLSDGTFSVTFFTRGLGGCWDWLCLGGAKEDERPLINPASASSQSQIAYQALAEAPRAAPVPVIDIAILEQKLRRLNENSQKAFSEYADTYVPIVERKKDETVDLEQDVAQFLHSQQLVFLLLGEAGTGKSLFLERLSCTLYQEKGAIPLFISLPSLKNPRSRCIEEALETLGCSAEEIAYLKSERHFVFILDAYDEIPLWENLYAANRLSEWKCKVIISCRTQSLPANYLDLFAPYAGGRIRYGLLRERTTTPFSSDQIDDFLKKMIGKEDTTWKTWTDCRRCIDEIPGLIFLVQNPFVLTLVVRFLPGVLERFAKLEKDEVLRLSRTELYRLFVENWFERQQKKLEVSGQIKDREDLRGAFFDFSKQLAKKMHEKGAFCVIYEEASLFGDQSNEWAPFFQETDPHTNLIRSGCPLRKVGNRWSFLHSTILEFFISEKLFEALRHLEERPGEEAHRALIRKTVEQLNEKLLVTQPSIIRFMADQVKSDRSFQKALFDIVLLSRAEPQVATAAANAMTILNAAGVSFSRLDLSGIRIPGAALTGAILDGTILIGADLRNVRFENAFIRKTVFSRAQMEGVKLGQRPSLVLENKGFQVALSPNGQWIAVGRKGGVDIFERAALKHIRFLHCGWKDEKEQVVNFSQDSQFLVVSAKDTRVSEDRKLIVSSTVVIDCKTWELRKFNPARDGSIPGEHFAFINARLIFSVRFDANNGLCVGSGIWDIVSEQLVKSYTKEECPISDSSTTFNKFSISPDGQIICIGGALYNISNLKKIADLPDSLPYATRNPFSADGRHVAYISHTYKTNSELVIFDVVTRKVVQKSKAPGYYPLVFSPDGRQIASASGNTHIHTIHLYDLKQERTVAVFNQHVEKIHDLRFSEDGTLLFSVSEDRTVQIQELTEEAVLDRSDKAVISSLSVSPEKGLIAGIDQRAVKFWNAATGELLFLSSQEKYNCQYVRFFDTNNYLAVWAHGGAHARVITILDLTQPITKKISTAYEHDAIAKPVAISPDGSCVAGVRITSGKKMQSKTTIRLWKLSQGPIGHGRRHDLLIDPDIARQQNLSPNSISHELQHEIPIEPNYDLYDLAFSPCGAFLAIACKGNKLTKDQGYLFLFNRKTRTYGERINCFSGSILFSKDAQFFIFTNNDHEICIYNMRDRKIAVKLPGHTTRISALAISENGSVLASGDCSGKISLWDIKRRQQTAGFLGHLQWIIGLWFTEGGRKLVSFSKDRIVRGWELYRSDEALDPCLQWASISQFYGQEVRVDGALGLSREAAQVLQSAVGVPAIDGDGDKYEHW